MKLHLVAIASLIPVVTQAAPQDRTTRKSNDARTAISSTLVVKVSDPAATGDALIALAESAGGYFSSRSDKHVTLKIPTAAAAAALTRIESMGKVVERSYSANDVGERLEELRTLLRSRKQVFQRYFAVLNTASQSAVVEVETQMTQLVQEIEQIKGQLRLIEHQLELAEIAVHFEMRERQPPARDGNSSFSWLNTVNIADLLEEFAHED